MGEVHECEKCRSSVVVSSRGMTDSKFLCVFTTVPCKKELVFRNLPDHCPDCGIKTRWEFQFTF